MPSNGLSSEAAPDSLRGESNSPGSMPTGFGADDDLVAASAQALCPVASRPAPQKELLSKKLIPASGARYADCSAASSSFAEHLRSGAAIPDNRHSQTSAAQLAILHRDPLGCLHRSLMTLSRRILRYWAARPASH